MFTRLVSIPHKEPTIKGVPIHPAFVLLEFQCRYSENPTKKEYLFIRLFLGVLYEIQVMCTPIVLHIRCNRYNFHISTCIPTLGIPQWCFLMWNLFLPLFIYYIVYSGIILFMTVIPNHCATRYFLMCHQTLTSINFCNR